MWTVESLKNDLQMISNKIGQDSEKGKIILVHDFIEKVRIATECIHIKDEDVIGFSVFKTESDTFIIPYGSIFNGLEDEEYIDYAHIRKIGHSDKKTIQKIITKKENIVQMENEKIKKLKGIF